MGTCRAERDGKAEREAGPPDCYDAKVDSDQWVVKTELSFYRVERDAKAERERATTALKAIDVLQQHLNDSVPRAEFSVRRAEGLVGSRFGFGE